MSTHTKEILNTNVLNNNLSLFFDLPIKKSDLLSFWF